jgi:hypothetical protein
VSDRSESFEAKHVRVLGLNAGESPTPSLLLDAGTGTSIEIVGTKADLWALLIRIAGELDALNND